MTAEEKDGMTERLRSILEAHGRALKVECLREDDQLNYEFRAWLGLGDRPVLDRVPRRALDDSSVWAVKPEVDAMIHRLASRLCHTENPVNDREMFLSSQLSVEQLIFGTLPEHGSISAYEVVERLLTSGFAVGQPASVAVRVNEVLDCLTLRQTYHRLYRGADGSYSRSRSEKTAERIEGT